MVYFCYCVFSWSSKCNKTICETPTKTKKKKSHIECINMVTEVVFMHEVGLWRRVLQPYKSEKIHLKISLSHSPDLYSLATGAEKFRRNAYIWRQLAKASRDEHLTNETYLHMKKQYWETVTTLHQMQTLSSAQLKPIRNSDESYTKELKAWSKAYQNW